MSHQDLSLSLQGKVAIITGSGRTRGIGAATATLLAHHGASVVLNYVSESTAPQAAGTAKKISDTGGKVAIVQADISTPAGAQKLVDQTIASFGGKIDILVNNAAWGVPGPALQSSPESIQKAFAVNVFGPIYLIQAAIKYMPPRSRIINIGSVASKLGTANIPIYGACKASVDALTFSLAMELGRNYGGITVNTISPGPVDTDALPPEVAESLHKAMMSVTRVEERVGTVNDIADAVLLLCSEKSRWISGQHISVSGGITGG